MLVFAILSLWQRTMAPFISIFFLYFYQLCELKERGCPAAHICRYFPLEFHQGFHLKCKHWPYPPDKTRTDTTAIDILLCNAVGGFSWRKFPQKKLNSLFHANKLGKEKLTSYLVCSEKTNCDNTPHLKHALIVKCHLENTLG